MTILKASGTSYIFGGFTSIDWGSRSGYVSDPNAFLFSLTNKANQPCKMRNIDTTKSIYCHPGYGPTFGYPDLHICDSANTTAGSNSYLGSFYQHPQSGEGVSFLAGSKKFKLDEIEVYEKE